MSNLCYSLWDVGSIRIRFPCCRKRPVTVSNLSCSSQIKWL